MKLTIGMAHHTDFDGAYFTIQDIRKELLFNGRADLLQKIEFIIVEDDKDGEHAKTLKSFTASNIGPQVSIVNLDSAHGTSATRNKIIEEATGQFVLVLDSHVLLCPTLKTIESLFTFMEYNKKTNDLYTGPLVYDSMGSICTHLDNEWGSGMWGKWGKAWQCMCESYNFSIIEKDKKCKFVSLVGQEEISKCEVCGQEFPKDLNYMGHQKKLNADGNSYLGYDSSAEPFEIYAQGLGLFLTRKVSWLGFNEHARGFGGEECYIHEKYRQAGRKTICLPFLKWVHRFDRAEKVKYPLSDSSKVKNYLLEFLELGLDFTSVKDYFVKENRVSEQEFNTLLDEALRLNGVEIDTPEASERDLIDRIQALQDELSSVSKNKSTVLMG